MHKAEMKASIMSLFVCIGIIGLTFIAFALFTQIQWFIKTTFVLMGYLFSCQLLLV
jgi:hypothetical protein